MYFETINKSLMKNLKQYYGGDMIDSDSLIVYLRGRFNGSEGQFTHRFLIVNVIKT